MGKYDHVFGAEGVSEQTLSPREAAAAIAVVTFAADGGERSGSGRSEQLLIESVEVLHAAYGTEECETLIDKLFGILNQEGIGVLFNTAVDTLSHAPIDESFNLIYKSFEGAIQVILENNSDSDDESKRTFFEKLAKVLGVPEDDAQDLLDVYLPEDEEV